MRKTATAQPRRSQGPKLRRPMAANHRFPTQRRLIMFEKIGRYAETVATSASLSRRGFLNRLSQAALGVAGLVGALLISPGKAEASPGLLRRCTYCCPDGSLWVKYCPC